VGSFTIKPIAMLMLIVVLAAIALVLVLPQVDLPDTVFQRNTAPLTVRSTAASAPMLSAVALGRLGQRIAVGDLFVQRSGMISDDLLFRCQDRVLSNNLRC
jgi:hypothetical protein